MTRRDKLLAAARNNPAGLRFDDFETLLSRSGWTLDHQGGSHRIWYSPQGSVVEVVVEVGAAEVGAVPVIDCLAANVRAGRISGLLKMNQPIAFLIKKCHIQLSLKEVCPNPLHAGFLLSAI